MIITARFDPTKDKVMMVTSETYYKKELQVIEAKEGDPLYDLAIEELGIEKILLETEKFVDLVEEEKKEKAFTERLNQLFIAKSDILNLEEVISSTNKEIKEKIRTASSVAEVYYYMNKL